jgi:hypothetical protein|tara:strand:- start:907 stop:1143 length:237 start_codon:yes stop_codon:yes gene_type:complete
VNASAIPLRGVSLTRPAVSAQACQYDSEEKASTGAKASVIDRVDRHRSGGGSRGGGSGNFAVGPLDRVFRWLLSESVS